ncbi:MAG: DUF6049 family protein, partial [Actinomycetota bacterium]|nr:DUF6049 family protein [Actinomycetota bacterium]
PTPAVAQDEELVRLMLISQTGFMTPERPLSIRVAAVNGSASRYTDLTLTVAVSNPVGSRSEYAQALETGSVSPLHAVPRPVQGALDPGATRAFQPMELELGALALADNALLPLTVELRADGGFTPVALLRSAVVYIGEDPPKVPLKVSVSFVIDEPLRRRPDGVFLDDVVERSVAPGGRLDAILSALEAVPVPVTLVVSPLLVEELRGMSDGYRIVRGGTVEEVGAADPRAGAAGAFVERLAVIAHRVGTEVVALPYASPSVPAMVGAGLDDDLTEHIRRGREALGSILGLEPSTTLFRPPASVLTAQTVAPLREILGTDGSTENLLLDPETLEAPEGLLLSPPAVARVGSEEAGLTAIAADPTVDQRLNAAPDDPRLAAMQALGELSALYFEQPSLDRGAAVVFGEDDDPDPVLVQTLLNGLRPLPGVSWLRPERATRVLVAEAGPEDPDLVERDLAGEDPAGEYDGEFLVELSRGREALAALASVGGSQELVDHIGKNSLLAESRYLLPRDELAVEYLRTIRGAVRAELSKVHPPSPSTITLTSRGGSVPVTLRSDADYPVRVNLTLSSPRLTFLEGGSRVVTLEQAQQAFVFPVRAQTTGRFPVEVRVATPTGMPIASSTIVIRSTAYNRVALVLTIGAAVFLLAWWGRRLLPRQKT